MTRSESPALRRWDGRAKVAAVWDASIDEENLHSSDANCRVYLSRENYLLQKPSFRVPFDQLIVKQCQPLLDRIVVDKQSSDISSEPPRLFLPGIDLQLPSKSSSCSLILPPPDTANTEEAHQFNVTTRNFFAWVVGASIVGIDPTYALTALKLRMDEWRTPSCNNTFAVQDYARLQFYTEPTVLQLSTKPSIQSLPDPPADYKPPYIPENTKLRVSGMVTAVRLGQSLGRRANAILNRRSTGPDPHDKSQIHDIASHIALNDSDKETSDQYLSSGCLVDGKVQSRTRSSASLTDIGRLSSAYTVTTDVADVKTLPSLMISVSSDASASSAVTTPNSSVNFPGIGSVVRSGWPLESGKEILHLDSVSKCNSPSSVGSSGAHNNIYSRHASLGDRRRQSIGTGPPSPILEEVTLPVKQSTARISDHSRSNSRRYSLPSGTNNLRSTSIPPSATTSNGPGRHSSLSFNSSTEARLLLDAKPVHEVCAACRRCKRPCAPPRQNDTASAMAAQTSIHSESIATTSHTGLGDAAPKMPNNDNLERKQDSATETIVSRFPSLRRLKVKSKATEHTKTEVPPQDSTSAHRVPKRSRSTPLVRSRVTRHHEIIPPLPTFTPPLKGVTPLSEQRYTPSVRSVETKASLTPVRPVSSREINAPLHREESTNTSGIDRESSEPTRALSNMTEQNEPVRTRPTSSMSMIVAHSNKNLEHTLSLDEERSIMRPASSNGILRTNRTLTIDRTISPIPGDFSTFMMKSNGARQSLAMLLSDQQESMKQFDLVCAMRESDRKSGLWDDQIILDRLLDGLQHLEPKTELFRQESHRRPVEPAYPGTPETRSPSAITKGRSASFNNVNGEMPLPPRSWGDNFRTWRSKYTAPKETLDSLPPPIVSSAGKAQIRVLTMDSSGKFSTSIVDSPI